MDDRTSGRHAEAQRSFLEFLRTDLELCFTFADVVNTELQMEERPAALRAKGKAEQGHDSIARLLRIVDAGAEKDAVAGRLAQLRVRLDGLQQQLYPATAAGEDIGRCI